MLFELFNKDLCFRALLIQNPNLELLYAVLRSEIHPGQSDVAQQNSWDRAVDRMTLSFAPIVIDGPGSTVPPGIASLLQELLAGLTHVDYRKRPPLAIVLRRIASALRVLENQEAYEKRLAWTRELRRRRIAKVKKAEARLLEARAPKLRGLPC